MESKPVEVNLNDFEFDKQKGQNFIKDFGNYVSKHYKPNRQNLNDFVLNLFNFLKWLPKYKFKEYFLKDLIGGITLGIVLIPQTIGYSLSGDLPPYQGLYTVPIAMLVYFIFGTGTHVALGIFAAVTILIRKETEKLEGKLWSSSGIFNENFISNDPIKAKVLICSNIAFLTGIFQILFSITHFGEFFTKYLSDIIVMAYTSATAYIILLTQFYPMLGIPNNSHPSQFEFLQELCNLFPNLHKTNVATLTISLTCLPILYIVKHFVNEKFKKKMVAPVPIEFLVLIFSTLFSYLFSFNQRWNIKVIGKLPIGYPPFQLPKFKYLPDLILPSFNVAIVSYSINISIAKLFSRKYDYKFKPNQEAFTYGLGNIILSLFSGVPSTGGLSRCAILEGIGIKTLVYSLYSSTIILSIIFFLAPLLATLPNAALGCIISVALLGYCKEVRQLKLIYKKSKSEGISFGVTWLGVIIFNVDYGLYIAMINSLFLIIFQSQKAYASLMGNIPKTDIYETIDSCKEVREIEGIKIIRFESSIFYANIDRFEYIVKKLSGINPEYILKKYEDEKQEIEKMSNRHKRKQIKVSKLACELNLGFEVETEKRKNIDALVDLIEKSIPTKHILVDFSCVNRIDSQAVEALIKLIKLYNDIGVTIYFTHLKRTVIRLLEKFNFRQNFDYRNLFFTTHDAVLFILNKKNKKHEINDIKYSIKIEQFDNPEDDIVEPEEAEDAVIEPVYKQKDDFDAFSDLMEKINDL